MSEKVCFSCGNPKSLDDFYRHPMMKDGHLNKCKVCARRDVQSNYYRNWEHYQEYEADRAQRNTRKKAQLRNMQNLRERDPEAYMARAAVSNALRGGRLTKAPCEVCGDTDVEAHHEDYKKPSIIR